MKADVLLGLQWGDEGKGKIVMYLHHDTILSHDFGEAQCRPHVEFNGIKHVLRTIPSGIFRENSINIIGNGVVIDPVVVIGEIEALKKMGVDVKSKLFFAKKRISFFLHIVCLTQHPSQKAMRRLALR